MSSLTALIKEEIAKQYKSVRKFALSVGIPPTTLSSALKNGIEGTSYDTVLKICKALSIRFIDNSVPIKVSDNALSFIQKYNSLDSVGKHTILSVLDAEYSRCNSDDLITGHIAAFGGSQSEKSNSKSDIISAHQALKQLKKKKIGD